MDQKPVSIQDIAREAGVSHSTVSRALRHSPLIREEVRTEINAIAKRMGYVPNAVAQSLQGSRTRTIGVIVTSISDPYVADVVTGIESVARPAGLSVLLSAAHNDPAAEQASLDIYRQRRVEAVLLVSLRTQPPDDSLMGLPTVFINNQFECTRSDIVSIAVDDLNGARQATEHVIALGHQRIAYLGVASRALSNRQRQSGFLDAMRCAGLLVNAATAVTDPTMDAEPETDLQTGQRAFQALHGQGITAVVCYNDMVALGVLLAARKAGVSVPGDLSVIGFDDVPIAQYATPMLSTMRQPREQLGRCAMQLLLDLPQHQGAQRHELSAELIVRESTAKPAAVQSRDAREANITDFT